MRIIVGVPIVVTNDVLRHQANNCIAMWDKIAHDLGHEHQITLAIVPNLMHCVMFPIITNHCEAIVLDNPLGNNVASSWNEIIQYAEESHDSEQSYIFIANSDVTVSKESFLALLNVLIDRPDVYIATGYNKDDWNEQATNDIDHTLADLSFFGMRTIDERRAIVGYFDTNFFPAYWEDSEYIFRLYLHGITFAKCKHCCFDHLGSSTIKHDPELSKVVAERFELNRMHFIHKWFPDHAAEALRILKDPQLQPCLHRLLEICRLPSYLRS